MNLKRLTGLLMAVACFNPMLHAVKSFWNGPDAYLVCRDHPILRRFSHRVCSRIPEPSCTELSCCKRAKPLIAASPHALKRVACEGSTLFAEVRKRE